MRSRAARRLLAVLGLAAALLVDLVSSAGPASAHNVSGGALPAPSWLLGWFGAICVLGAAVALRTSWPTARLRLGVDRDGIATVAERRTPATAVGQGVGLAVLVLVVVAAFVGPDEPAANIAPLVVYPVGWVVLPFLCLPLGDLVRLLNPWEPVVATVDRVVGTDRGARWRADGPAPRWTAAAFLWAFSWFLLAYHRPGSPRAVAVFLLSYSGAAVLGGLRWGRTWLHEGEGFAGLSRAVGHLVHRRGDGPAPGLLALVAVWIGATAFHGVANTTWWVDVEGATSGWTRTGVNTLGLVWLTGGAAVVVLFAVRLLVRRDAPDATDRPWPRGAPVAVLGLALVPLALAWFVAYELTFTVLEGQNFLILLSDPVGRGWDLFHTMHLTIDYRVATGGWVRWAQEVLLLTGHLTAVVLAHDAALRVVGRRRGMRVTWTAAGLSSVSMVSACLLVLR
jgi:hypothetical protein